jgi:transcriptional pleiotropic repressor
MYEALSLMSKKITALLQNGSPEPEGLLREFLFGAHEALSAEALFVDKGGALMSAAALAADSAFAVKKVNGAARIEGRLNEHLNKIFERRDNVSLSGFYPMAPRAGSTRGYAVISPIICGGLRIGVILFHRFGAAFSEEELALCDCVISICGLIASYEQKISDRAESSREEAVKSAMSALSYSELKAVVCILKELGALEGCLISGHMAEKAGVTRSVMVSALRKLESAGVIESRSLGMKGTYIKVTNPKLIDEIEAYTN